MFVYLLFIYSRLLQALYKQIQKGGLQKVYIERGATHFWLRQLMALAFLPVHLMRATLGELAAEAKTEAELGFIDYMKKTWYVVAGLSKLFFLRGMGGYSWYIWY